MYSVGAFVTFKGNRSGVILEVKKDTLVVKVTHGRGHGHKKKEIARTDVIAVSVPMF